MGLEIRSEKVLDYSHIANVNYEAFLGWHPDNPYVSEPIIVDLLRHNSLYDPELSLVAEMDGKIVGHALFSPFKFIVLGTEQRGVVLAPIAVHPDFQLKGIGGKLIEEGHRRALGKGFAFSLLCGHSEYYPRFGYKTKMFSFAGVKVIINIENFKNDSFEERPVCEKDIPWLQELWYTEHRNYDLMLCPGSNICEWSNHSPACKSSVIALNGRPIGYVRYAKNNPLSIKSILSADDNMAELLVFMTLKCYGRSQGVLNIPLAIDSVTKKLKKREGFDISDERIAYDAFMINVLDNQNGFISKYCDLVETSSIKPGIIIFPPMFDVDDGRVE